VYQKHLTVTSIWQRERTANQRICWSYNEGTGLWRTCCRLCEGHEQRQEQWSCPYDTSPIHLCEWEIPV